MTASVSTGSDWRSHPAIRPALRLARRLRFRQLHRADARVRYREYGSDYGSWPVIEGSLDAASVVYSVGVGEDLSFDLAVTQLYGCTIDAFDPTPRSLAWVARQSLPPTIRVHPYGLAARQGVLRFAEPRRDGHVSYSAVTDGVGGAGAADGAVVELPVRALDDLMAQLGHTRIDYLKMDIEGSEYEVIADMVAKTIAPAQLCIEFHHGMHGYSDDDTRLAVERLRGLGYRLHYVADAGREYGFHQPAALRG